MSSNREWGYVVGAVVGYFTGGASYVALGATVGGVVGGLLDPKAQVQGPRLDDLKVQISTYGVGIPRLYGTERISPNVIWSTDKIEISSTSSAGGKGGGVENTNYRYYVQMRLLLCATKPEDVAIVQMYQDGKLIYDARSGAPVASALASAENPYAYFTLYQGRADQLPDPVEELYEDGPGSVPAYRGVVSISMKGIECPGGRVPQFSFVLSNSAEVGTINEPIAIFEDALEPFESMGGFVTAEGALHYRADEPSHSNPKYLDVSIVGPGYQYPSYSQVYRTPTTGPSAPIAVVGGDPAFLQLSHESSGDEAAGIISVYRIDASNGSSGLAFTAEDTGETIYGYEWAAYDTVSNQYVLVPDTISAASQFLLQGDLISPPAAGFGPVAFYNEQIYMVAPDGSSVSIWSEGAFGTPISIPFSTLGFYKVLIRADADGVYVLCIDSDNAGGIWKIEGDQAILLTNDLTIDSELGLPVGIAWYTTFYATKNYAILGPNELNDGTFSYVMIRFNAADPINVRVADVIAGECQVAEETRYDVSAIPEEDTIRGYKITTPANARANIDPLLTAFQIFIVDEDGLIKFKKYEDIVSVATVTYDELGQAEDGSEPADAMPLTRTQEIDLPRSVAVSYIEPLIDYQVATEKEIRQVTEATEDMQVQLPLALGSSDQAKKAASNILFSRWRSQNTRTCVLSRKYAFLSPGDGITVEYPLGTFRLWRITSMADTGTVIELSMEPGDANLYEQTAAGATGYVGQQVAPITPPTKLQLLDIPILRDVDNNAGIYAVMDGMGPGWPGAELFTGPDDANLLSSGTVSTGSPIGVAQTLLGNWQRNLVDETNLVTISIGAGVVSSVTREQLLSGAGEYWACGVPGRWEIGASATVASLGSGQYILSRHLRGLFGTEANAALHQAGDQFVILRIAGMLRPNQSVGSIGQALSYRAVTKGRSFDSATSQTYANMAEGLEPLSPVNARRSMSSTDITLTADRRSRLAMNNATGTLPLGEASEVWSWKFYTDGTFSTLAGILTSSTGSVTITAAQQTAFGLTPGATVYVRISLVSDTVGIGHELQAIL